MGSAGNNTSFAQKAFNLGMFGLPTALTAPARAAKSEEDSLNKTRADQAAQAAQLEQQTLEQPKMISPDNFLATKAKQLANLRLGLASTITPGASGAPSAVISSPSLTANGPGKNKMGQ